MLGKRDIKGTKIENRESKVCWVNVILRERKSKIESLLGKRDDKFKIFLAFKKQKQ